MIVVFLCGVVYGRSIWVVVWLSDLVLIVLIACLRMYVQLVVCCSLVI